MEGVSGANGYEYKIEYNRSEDNERDPGAIPASARQPPTAVERSRRSHIPRRQRGASLALKKMRGHQELNAFEAMFTADAVSFQVARASALSHALEASTIDRS